MLDLSKYNIGLVLISDIKLEDSIIAFNQCKNLAKFSSYQFFTSKDISINDSNIDIIKINPINSLKEYSYFILTELNKYIKTDYILICQYDGYIVNPNFWYDEYLNYDYIGAPFNWKKEQIVGNGGFSLRSKHLLNELDKYKDLINVDDKNLIEDFFISVSNRTELEEHGIKFPNKELAKLFSWEKHHFSPHYKNQFGVHLGHYEKNYKKFIKEGVV